MEKKIITIKGQPYYYDAIELSEDTAPAITFDEAKALLFKTKDILDDLGISFSLAFGTLLGAIRERSFISHDYDIDIMTFELDHLLEAIPIMEKKGLKLCRVTDGRLYSFRINEFYIDIYIIKNAPSILGWFSYMIGSDTIWKSYLKGFETIDFMGREFNIPKRPERVVKFWYGKSWRTPIPGYNGQPNIFPVYLYRKYLKKFIIK